MWNCAGRRNLAPTHPELHRRRMPRDYGLIPPSGSRRSRRRRTSPSRARISPGDVGGKHKAGLPLGGIEEARPLRILQPMTGTWSPERKELLYLAFGEPVLIAIPIDTTAPAAVLYDGQGVGAKPGRPLAVVMDRVTEQFGSGAYPTAHSELPDELPASCAKHAATPRCRPKHRPRFPDPTNRVSISP